MVLFYRFQILLVHYWYMGKQINFSILILYLTTLLLDDHIIWTKIVLCFPFQSVYFLFLFLTALAETSSIMLKISGKGTSLPCSWSYGKFSEFLITKYVSNSFFINSQSIMNRCWILSNAFPSFIDTVLWIFFF